MVDSNGATGQELRQQIANARDRLEESRRRSQRLDQELAEADERQQLRRVLDSINTEIAMQQDDNEFKHFKRRNIDADISGAHLPSTGGPLRPASDCSVRTNPRNGEIDVTRAIERGEYLWRLRGMSWLENALAENNEDAALSDDFRIGNGKFDLMYAPSHACINEDLRQLGSLVIRHREDCGIIFRYKFFIKRAGGDFVQWGEECNACAPTWYDCDKMFGPDVRMQGEEPTRPLGIFGLSHAELLKSEWVDNDTLTVKVQVEVMIGSDTSTGVFSTEIDVPAPSMSDNLLTMLEDSQYTDTTFVVDGQHIRAHSQILSARSEVLARELNGGMQESFSKTVEVRDADFATFRIFIYFLYTDDFDRVMEMIKLRVDESSVAAAADSGESPTPASDVLSVSPIVDLVVARQVNSISWTSILQDLLAVSHKYQVKRLRLWCEQQLCEYISKDEVCAILCQACLYEAVQLEKACLTFIKRHMDAVVATPSFGSLSAQRPDVMLKINVFLADLSETGAAAAIQAHRYAKAGSAQQETQPEAEPEAAQGGIKRKHED